MDVLTVSGDPLGYRPPLFHSCVLHQELMEDFVEFLTLNIEFSLAVHCSCLL